MLMKKVFTKGQIRNIKRQIKISSLSSDCDDSDPSDEHQSENSPEFGKNVKD